MKTKIKRLTKQEMINSCLQLVDKSFKLTPYDPRFNTHNKLEHELAKSKILYLLKKQKLEAYAEVIFTNGKRADVLIPEIFKVIEVLCSETEKEVLAKIEDYPLELDIEYYTTKQIFNSKFLI